MEEKTVWEKLDDFQKFFNLEMNEVDRIAEHGTPDWEERVEKMDEVRKELDTEFNPGPEFMRELLFAHNKNLKQNYYGAMVEGKFDEVLADIRSGVIPR